MNIKYNKICKAFLALVIFAGAFFMGSIKSEVVIDASTLTNTTPTGYHHTGTANGPGGQVAWYTNQSIEYIEADGNVVFCVQPYRVITDTLNYTPNAIDNQVLSRIGYYGYTSTSKSFWDYAVSQLMIWEALGYTPDTADVSNYEARKAEINLAIADHELTTSFNGSTYTLNKNESINIQDTNGKLSSLNLISNTTGASASISGNILSIIASGEVQNSGEIRFQKFLDSSVGVSIMYTHPSSQDVALLRLNDPIRSNVNLRMVNGTVEIQKTGKVFTSIVKSIDENGNETNVPQYELKGLPETEFTIKAKIDYVDHSGNIIRPAGQVVEVITSDVNGVAKSGDLGEGVFTIEETKQLPGYNKDTTVNEFTVTADGGVTQLRQLNLVNEKKVQFYTINKTLEENPIDALANKDAYKDVEFTVYAKKDIKNFDDSQTLLKDAPIARFGIDADGKAITRIVNSTTGEVIEKALDIQLPDGEYYVVETTTNSSYVLDNTKYDFIVDSDTTDQTVKVAIHDDKEIVNKLKTYKVKVNKQDSVSYKALTNLNFKFEAKLFDKEGVLVETIVKDANTEDGTVSFDIKGQVSKVEIREIEAPKGFKLSTEVKAFAIDNETEKTLFDEDFVYSFVYLNDAFPDDQIRKVSTGDDSGSTTYLSYIGVASLMIGLIGFARFRRKESYEA